MIEQYIASKSIVATDLRTKKGAILKSTTKFAKRHEFYSGPINAGSEKSGVICVGSDQRGSAIAAAGATNSTACPDCTACWFALSTNILLRHATTGAALVYRLIECFLPTSAETSILLNGPSGCVGPLAHCSNDGAHCFWQIRFENLTARSFELENRTIC